LAWLPSPSEGEGRLVPRLLVGDDDGEAVPADSCDDEAEAAAASIMVSNAVVAVVVALAWYRCGDTMASSGDGSSD